MMTFLMFLIGINFIGFAINVIFASYMAMHNFKWYAILHSITAGLNVFAIMMLVQSIQ